MTTIVEPKEKIVNLWGKQQATEDQTYRLMRYVILTNHKGNVLLHNVITGQLVVLDQDEAEAIDKLPMQYIPVLEQLVTDYYLVPEDYDEHLLVLNLRTILRKYEAAYPVTGITHFVILPTTACNARCYYCYQQGIPIATMTKETAEQVVEFIEKNCGEIKKVSITWFGGEPSLAVDRIDQICEGLHNKGINYLSLMISNGYAFDEKMIERAKKLWHLNHITITVDGPEDTYNKTKAYVNVSDSPFQRVMHNIGLLLNDGISVKIRMNYDATNWFEYAELVQEVKNRFPNSNLLEMSAHRILGEFPYWDGMVHHAEDKWFEQKKVEFDSITRAVDLFRRKPILPNLRYHACGAANGMTAVITPEGNLVSCPDQLETDQIIGNVWDGIVNTALVAKWKQFAEYTKCNDCVFMPYCVHMLCCNAKDSCASKKVLMNWTTMAMQQMLNSQSII